MYKYIAIFLFSLCFNTNSSAVSIYVDGIIILKDGSELTGLVQFLGAQCQAAKSIKFKKTKNEKSQKFASNDIKYIVITEGESTNMLFKRPGEEIPTELGKVRYVGNQMESESGKKQRKKMAIYFEDNPQLVSKIEKNEWNVTDFLKISNEYCGAFDLD